MEGGNLCDDAPCDSVTIANKFFLCDIMNLLFCVIRSLLFRLIINLLFSLGNSDSVVNDTVDCANDYSVAESDFVCPVCLKTFTNKYNLKHHANKLHSSNIALIEPLKNYRSQSFNYEENQLILNEVTKKKSQTLSLEHRKVELRQKCLKLLNSDKQCDVFDRILKSAPPQLEAVDMLNAQEIHFPTANKDVPPNKNIIPQRFSNAKKKRKLTKTSTVTSQNADNNTILKIILDHKNFTHSPTKES
ncbi:hypothetical protein TNCT_469491 [Trichonephila clavata]|uniref:C2H2-type domain-containing protein n=1 Tax=Trichonephila clavata TaxID=2740835 RepID=A0A8X6FLC0_TRICU|nr:hypothetical protein TNCT_469491 [Trichonephila clavata]